MHCTHCGEPTTSKGHHRRCPSCGHTDYVNPAPAVGVAILRGEEILLARRAREPFEGMWDMVGGFVEPDESAADAITREVLEETSMRLQDAQLVDVLPGDYAGRPTLNLLYLGTAEGEPRASDDVAELRWFHAQSLPDDLAWPHEAAVLGRIAGMMAAIKAQQ